jgi:hypothetical protein
MAVGARGLGGKGVVGDDRTKAGSPQMAQMCADEDGDEIDWQARKTELDRLAQMARGDFG